MVSGIKKHAFLLLAGATICLLALALLSTQDAFSGIQNLVFKEGTVLFVGDIMLGRSVERTIDREGIGYPFAGVTGFLFDPDVTVGNFEGSIPEVHTPTPNFSFAFSIRPEFLGALKEEGFDVLSLANNHAFDYGGDGFRNTMDTCEEMGMICVGHPREVSGYATTVVSAGDTTVGLLAIHTLFVPPPMEEVEQAISELKEITDVQIAYIHWGDEYEPHHNTAQETLAHTLIDLGVDGVIGHHPHVVQDIEIYNGKPIFYSLGNFIFDQYWSVETQEGLTLELLFEADMVTYTPIPITSIGTHTQPHLLSSEESTAVVEALFARSSGVEAYREGGVLRIPR